ncbi:MAG: histidine phosphatase family protein [Deltaproteobacteria bacterium]|nr:histidine phosphatase family protein [Deltaproteobacteria bacterium]
MSIFIVRHGETDLNATRVVQLPETGLSVRGRAQAACVADRFAALGIARVLSSDLARAVETTAVIAARTGAPVTYEPTLRERDFGDLRGTPYADLDVDIFAPDYIPPAGESWETFRERVAIAWEHILTAARATPGHLVVVTHGLVCHVLLDRHARCTGAVPLRWHNTSVTELEHVPPWTARVVNCTAHLGESGGDGGATLAPASRV